MNDGISQDSWQRVKEASQRLNETGAERFGVALGGQVRVLFLSNLIVH